MFSIQITAKTLISNTRSPTVADIADRAAYDTLINHHLDKKLLLHGRSNINKMFM